MSTSWKAAMSRDPLALVATADRPGFDRQHGHLLGSTCLGCRLVNWPPRAVCQRCGSRESDVAPLAGTATLLSETTVWVSRPNIQAPYTLGMIRLDEGPILFAHVRSDPGDTTRIGALLAVRFANGVDEVPAFWFVPEAGHEA